MTYGEFAALELIPPLHPNCGCELVPAEAYGEANTSNAVSIGSLSSSFGKGFVSFFVNQWNDIASIAKALATDPVEVYKSFYTNPVNYIKLLPLINMWYDQGKNVISGADLVASGDFNAMAERLGMNSAEAAEQLIIMLIGEALVKGADKLKVKGGAVEVYEGAGKGSLKVVEGGNYSASEVKAAEYMRDLGNDVTLRPPTGTRIGGGTSDLVVNGVNYDVYTPTTSNPSRIIGAIADKNSQAVGIVLDLSKTSVTTTDLGNVLTRVEGVITAVGKVCNIKDIIILP